jgi:CheY-like chemotaxis protein
VLDYTDVEIVAVSTGGEALDVLARGTFDCMMLDLRLPDMTGFELLGRLHAEATLADIAVPCAN